MSRFFFHIHDGVSVPDEVGQDLPDLDAVRREAVSRAGRALRDDPGQFWAGEDWSIDVRNEHDVILLTLQFLATEAPALDGRGGRPPDGRDGAPAPSTGR